jgi:hypothetical protein
MFKFFSPAAVFEALSHDEFRPLLLRVADPALDSMIGNVLPSADSDTSDYYLTRAILADAAGKNNLVARAFYAGALSIAEKRMAENPLAVLPHADRAVALAGLGRRAEARAEAAKAVALLNEGGLITGSRTVTAIAVEWAYLQILLAAGERREALARMKIQLERPGMLSPDWIQADPQFSVVVATPEYHALKRAFFERLSYPVLHHGADPKTIDCPKS